MTRAARGPIVLGLLVALSAAAAAAPRDPFVFGPRSEDEGPKTPVLVGVLWDTARPLAVIDDREASTGDEVGGWRITAIRPDGVQIQRDGRQEFLTPGTAFPSD